MENNWIIRFDEQFPPNLCAKDNPSCACPPLPNIKSFISELLLEVINEIPDGNWVKQPFAGSILGIDLDKVKQQLRNKYGLGDKIKN